MRKILITGGDPAGIGPELFEKALADFFSLKSSLKKALAIYPKLCFIYFNTSSSSVPTHNGGHKEKLKSLCQKRGILFQALAIDESKAYQDIRGIKNTKISFIFCSSPSRTSHDTFPKNKRPRDIRRGEPSPYSGHLAFQALKQACDFALEFGCDAMLNLPLSKEWVVRSGKSGFRGHTGYLAERFSCEVLMLMHGLRLSVIPLTVHIPLAKASRQLKKIIAKPALVGLLGKVGQISDYQKGGWALCGFNPHAGENALMGSEEKFLKRFSQKLCQQGLPVAGPFAADALFTASNRAKYRLILSCYHDQGLIPFKALEGSAGVNCTIGLPFLRTSPDHGTAFELAGKKKADTRSMSRALELAVFGFDSCLGTSL